ATVPNGDHVLTARARDAGGNLTTSDAVAVTVSNAASFGLVLALGFNEGSGATTADASNFGNDGTITGATWTASGRFGGALSFDGINDLITVADAASLDLTAGMTLEAWVQPSAVTNKWRDLIYKGNDIYFLEATSTNNNRPAGGAKVGTSLLSTYGPAPLAPNTWSHLALTYDGAALQFFVNGVEVSSAARTGSIQTSSNPLQIGGDSLYGQYFAGLIDEVRVYNRALSSAEIQNDMNTGVQVIPDSTPPVVAITAPQEAATVTGTINVTADATDNVGVVGVQFLLDDVPLGAEDTQAPYSVAWDTTTASRGNHVLTARARDAAGNLTDFLRTVMVVPKLVITFPTNNGTVTSSTINVAYTTIGDVTGIDHVHFFLDGVEVNDPTFDGSLELTDLNAGPHVLTGFLLHSAEAESGDAVSFSFVLPDNTPPSVAVTAPANGATVSTSVTIDASAADDVGVGGVQFLLDGIELGAEDTTAPYSISWDTTTASNGPHTLSARARDAAGNTATSAGVLVTVSNVAPSGLVLALGFNEGSGATAGDSSGFNNHGAIAGATWTGAGRFGGALSFDGLNDLITVADADALDLTAAMTLEAWVNPSAVTKKWRDVLYKGSDIYFLEATSTSSSRPAGGAKVGTSLLSTYGTSPLVVSTWSHLALTYDGALLRLYLNGVQVSSAARTGAIQTSTNPLQIGGDSLYGQFFAGLIDEVRVYNRALSETEIQADMATPVGSPLQLLGEAVAASGAGQITADAIGPLVNEAVARWLEALGGADSARRIADIQVQVIDLPGRLLGLASTSMIWIDANAAGHGWFLDATPEDDAEFESGIANSPAAGRADLLTVLAHELGHVLGLDDDAAADPFGDEVMGAALPLGVRRIHLQASSLQVQALDTLWARLGHLDE
ncbi:MAG: hypothetical protein HY000_40500, partial [Planctomycetes bacterium]|nr:hypothetical protein [Planctomycetota bacterium]